MGNLILPTRRRLLTGGAALAAYSSLANAQLAALHAGKGAPGGGGGGTNGSYGQGTTNQTATATLTSVVAGSALYATIIDSATSATMSGYTLIGTVSGGGFNVRSFHKDNVTSGSQTATGTPTGGTVFGIILSELRNVAAAAFDVAPTNGGTFSASTSTAANAMVSGTITPSASGNILISHFWTGSTFAVGTTLAWTGGGANDQTNGAGDEWFVATGTGSVQATWTNSGASSVNFSTLASFHHA